MEHSFILDLVPGTRYRYMGTTTRYHQVPGTLFYHLPVYTTFAFVHMKEHTTGSRHLVAHYTPSVPLVPGTLAQVLPYIYCLASYFGYFCTVYAISTP
jgi:hypothetical protein